MGGWIAEEMNWTVCGRVECNVREKATRLTILLKYKSVLIVLYPLK